MFKPDRINIHELTIDDPEKQSELAFDSERDITEDDWEKMKRTLDLCRLNDNWSSYFSQAADMKILNPEWDLNLNGRALLAINDKLKQSRESQNWQGFLSYASDRNILGARFNYAINPEERNSLEQELESYIKAGNWSTVLGLALALRIIDPQFDLKLNDQNYKI